MEAASNWLTTGLSHCTSPNGLNALHNISFVPCQFTIFSLQTVAIVSDMTQTTRRIHCMRTQLISWAIHWTEPFCEFMRCRRYKHISKRIYEKISLSAATGARENQTLRLISSIAPNNQKWRFYRRHRLSKGGPLFFDLKKVDGKKTRGIFGRPHCGCNYRFIWIKQEIHQQNLNWHDEDEYSDIECTERYKKKKLELWLMCYENTHGRGW